LFIEILELLEILEILEILQSETEASFGGKAGMIRPISGGGGETAPAAHGPPVQARVKLFA
jgi:hypothetical protein